MRQTSMNAQEKHANTWPVWSCTCTLWVKCGFGLFCMCGWACVALKQSSALSLPSMNNLYRGFESGWPVSSLIRSTSQPFLPKKDLEELRYTFPACDGPSQTPPSPDIHACSGQGQPQASLFHSRASGGPSRCNSALLLTTVSWSRPSSLWLYHLLMTWFDQSRLKNSTTYTAYIYTTSQLLLI